MLAQGEVPSIKGVERPHVVPEAVHGLGQPRVARVQLPEMQSVSIKSHQHSFRLLLCAA